MLRSHVTRAIVLVTVFCACLSTAQATNVLVPHQGRLLDGAEQPITGTRDITYSIYDAPTGGALLWTEMHPSVSVQAGLFDAMLGTITPLPSDVFRSASGTGSELPDRWLEVHVGATTLSPRLRLGATPYAVTSSSVSGDIRTSKGLAEVRDFSSATEDAVILSSSNGENGVTLRSLNGLPPGTPVIGTMSMTTTPSSATLGIGDLDGDGLYRVFSSVDSVVREISVTDNGPGGTALMKAKEKANRTKCGNNLRAIGPATTTEIDNSCDLIGATMKAIQTKGTGAIAMTRMDADDSAGVSTSYDADGNGDVERSTLLSTDNKGAHLRGGCKGVAQVGLGVAGNRFSSDANDSGTSFECVTDLDGDGHAGTQFTIQARDQYGNSRLAVDANDDGIADNSMESSCDASSVKVIMDRDSGRSKARFIVDAAGPIVDIAHDVDGNGVADNIVVSECNDAGASQRVLSLNGLPPGEPVIGTLSMTTTPSSATLGVGDLDGDGLYRVFSSVDSVVKEISVIDNGPIGATSMKAKEKANRTKCSSNLRCQSPTVSHEMDASCDVASSQIAVSSDTPGGPGSLAKSATLTVSATPGGSACRAIATKGNGETLKSSLGATEIEDAHLLLEADTDGDGTSENTISQTCDASSSRQIMAGTTSLVGSGGASHLTMEASPTGSSVVLEKGDVEVGMESKDESGSYTGEFRITVTGIKSPGLKVSLNSDGIGYLSDRLGVGVSAPTHHIDVVGGAYCDGSNWVNASDENSKENFKKVDGEDLLDKISELDITKWNYKNDKSTEHIGPTAQDFKETFGVGSDGKSISTIDPSGIALAAIKELYSQLKEKDKEMAEMRSELAKLKKELAKKN